MPRMSSVRRRVLLAALVASVMASPEAAMAIEQPEYTVVRQDGAFELRRYAPYLLAETEVESGFMEAGNVAFGRLFRYISGDNTARAEIAMTAPVEQAKRGEKIAMTAPVEQAREGGVYRVAFVVPRKYDRDTVPQPTDPRVRIREVPARSIAVWRYSGRWTEENFREHERELRGKLAALGLKAEPGDSAIIARYDAPFMPWFMRRNEVLIPVTEPAVSARPAP
ncbi:MAG: SOUL family heme-binding protein [Gammaproteobacteria bacterium]